MFTPSHHIKALKGAARHLYNDNQVWEIYRWIRCNFFSFHFISLTFIQHFSFIAFTLIRHIKALNTLASHLRIDTGVSNLHRWIRHTLFVMLRHFTCNFFSAFLPSLDFPSVIILNHQEGNASHFYNGTGVVGRDLCRWVSYPSSIMFLAPSCPQYPHFPPSLHSCLSHKCSKERGFSPVMMQVYLDVTDRWIYVRSWSCYTLLVPIQHVLSSFYSPPPH